MKDEDDETSEKSEAAIDHAVAAAAATSGTSGTARRPLCSAVPFASDIVPPDGRAQKAPARKGKSAPPADGADSRDSADDAAGDDDVIRNIPKD